MFFPHYCTFRSTLPEPHLVAEKESARDEVRGMLHVTQVPRVRERKIVEFFWPLARWVPDKPTVNRHA